MFETTIDKRIAKAKEILFEKTPTDRIIETHHVGYFSGYFIEFLVSAGGDYLTFRVYDNGTVTER